MERIPPKIDNIILKINNMIHIYKHFLLKLPSVIFGTKHDSATIIMVWQKVFFFFFTSILPFTLTNWNPTVRKSCFFCPIYCLFNHLFVSVLHMGIYLIPWVIIHYYHYFVTHIVQDLIIGSSFELASTFFHIATANVKVYP